MTEWSDAIKNAIVVVIIVVVVGIIFGFIYMAMQSNQEGQDKLSSQLSSFDEKSYSPYDGTQVTGQVVISAIQQYTGTDIAVCVNTNGGNGGNAALSGQGTVAWYCRSLKEGARNDHGDTGQDDNSANGQSTWELTDEKTPPVFATADDHKGSCDAPTTIASATTKSYNTYINSSAKFFSVLHYNSNDVVVGIEFTQTH